MNSFTPELKTILREAGCEFVRHGRGDHEIWQSPINGHRFVVDNAIPSRHLANAVLKQPDCPRRSDADQHRSSRINTTLPKALPP